MITYIKKTISCFILFLSSCFMLHTITIQLTLSDTQLLEKHAPPTHVKEELDVLLAPVFFKQLIKYVQMYNDFIKKEAYEAKHPNLKEFNIMRIATQDLPDLAYNPRIPFSHLRIICTHTALKDFIIKIGLPLTPSIKTTKNIDRIKGVELVNAIIKEHNLKHIITPKKYLYHLLEKPYEFDDSNYIIIEEKLDLLDKSSNFHFFRTNMSRELTTEYLILITSYVLEDCTPNNCYVTKNGKLAFFDTEDIVGRSASGHTKQTNEEKINHFANTTLELLPPHAKEIFSTSKEIKQNLSKHLEN